MELGLEVGLEGEVDGAGSVVLPGRLLVEVARSLPDGPVTLELREAERDVEISAGSSRFHLRTLPADDFPRFPETEGDPVELPAAPLRDTINRVARAASRDEARPVLTGVLVTVEGERDDDGRHRLLPARREDDQARGLGRRSGSRRTSRPGRCASWPG